MQRRSHQPSSSNPLFGGPRQASGPLSKKGKKKGGGIISPSWSILVAALGLMALVSWYFFPSTVLKVEEEAKHEMEQFAKQAIEAEHRVEDWFTNKDEPMRPNNADDPNDRSASEAATARMMAQESKWVDGEKKLKAKLKELAERQQRGELLGVPVLTRWLGEDFPAWVEPGMDEAEWKKNVEAKYAEMRKEEEEWQRKMQVIIDQRERDLGITTA